MKPIAIKLFGEGIQKEYTSQMFLSVKPDGKWRMSHVDVTNGAIAILEGDDTAKGAAAFLEELHRYIAYWAIAKMQEIEKTRSSLNGIPRDANITQPGFRPDTPLRLWTRHINGNVKEVKLFRDAYYDVLDQLADGWMAERDTTPFPEFTYGEPDWQHLDSTVN